MATLGKKEMGTDLVKTCAYVKFSTTTAATTTTMTTMTTFLVIPA